jgi:type IV fimbrial biogenesis protein FimT
MLAMSPHRQRGVTLLELMTVVAILAVLAAIAVPSFRTFIVNQRIRNASFELQAALTAARGQAITQNGTVSLNRTGTTWDQGWTVSATDTSGTTVFDTRQPFNNLRICATPDTGTISYGRDGRATTTAQTQFTIQLPPSESMNGIAPRCVTLSVGGLPTSSPSATCPSCS